MARTAKLELEVGTSRLKPGVSTADSVLQGLKKTARGTMDELRDLSKQGDNVGAGMRKVGSGAAAADKELRRTGDTARDTTKAMKDLNKEAEGASDKFGKGTEGVNDLIDSLTSLKNIAIVGVFLATSKAVLDASDKVKQMNAQLQLAIPATTNLANAQRDVRRIAADTRGDLEATNDLYAKFSRSSSDLGKSQTDASRATETFAKTMKISGASTEDAANVTRQFGQALASGQLRGDEFNSVMETSPRLARLLADSLNVNIGRLRAMAAEGELSADKLYKALTEKKFTDTIDAEFKTLPVTFGEAMTRITDSGTLAFAAFDSGGEFSQSLVNFALGGVESLDTVEKRAQDLGIEFRSIFAGLATVFEPITNASDDFFGRFEIKITSFRDQIASLLNGYDQVNNLFINAGNWATGVDNAIKGKLNTAIERSGGGTKFQMGALTPGSDREAAWLQGYDQQTRNSQNKILDRKVNDSLPEWMQFKGAGDVRAFVRGAYVDTNKPKPQTSGDPNGADKEIGRKMTGVELDAKLAGIGARVTSRARSVEQQQAQIDKWLREDPKTRGIRPAAATKSDHVVNGDTTRDIARGKGVSIASITAAVGKDNIKQLLNEGDHFHLALKPNGAKGGAAGGKSEAEKEADKQATLAKRRKEDEADFYQTLQNQAKTAAMLPAEAEQYNEELKLRRILNDGNVAGDRELSDLQKKRIADGIAERNLAEFVSAGKRDGLAADREAARLADVGLALSKSTRDSEADNLAIQEKLWPIKLDALDKGLSLTDETVTKVLSETEARERTNLTLERKNRLIAEGNSLVDSLVDAAKPGEALKRNYDRDVERVGNSSRSQADKDIALAELAKKFGVDMDQISSRFRVSMLGHIEEIGAAIGGKVGSGVSAVGSIATLLNDQNRADYKTGSIGEQANNPVSKVATELKGVTGQLSTTFGGKTGTFFKGLGDKLGKASDGAAVGAQVGQLAKALGVKKFSQTGAQIGGAIGSYIPIPGGQIIGSVAGGLLGGLFKKNKQASAGFEIEDGRAVSVAATGKGKQERAVATELATSVASGLNSIADTLGGTLTDIGISVGYRPGHKAGAYRVDPTGQGKLKDGSVMAFETEAEAVAAALKLSIKKGVLGLSGTISRILNANIDDLDKAVQDALTFKNWQDEFRNLSDPINAALETLNTSFKSLQDIMKGAGATAQEVANAEFVYQRKRADIIEQGNDNALKEMRSYLFEKAGGASSDLSPEQRLSTSRAELDRLDALKKSGGKVEFSDYKSTADSFLAASRDRNGSGIDYFADLKRVTDAVQGMINTTTSASITAPDLAPVTKAIDTQTSAVVAVLSSIDAKLGAGAAVASPANDSYSPEPTAGRYQVNMAGARYYGMN